MGAKEVRQGRINARAKRLEEPREPRMGKIKLGQLVKKCRGTCKKTILAHHTTCPDCGSDQFSPTFPRKTNHYVFYRDGQPSAGHERFGPAPVIIPFTFKRLPTDCVRIARVCYQGGKLFCLNVFETDATGQYHDRRRAFRMGKEIECDPTRCPYSVGGEVTGPDGRTRTIPHDRPQCGEKITMQIWLPDLPGFDAYEHQSGSITTINNIQVAIRDIMALFSQRGIFLPVKLELRLQKTHSMYPDETGKMFKTEFYASVIHFPHSLKDLQERYARRELEPTDIVYQLPQQIFQPMLPGPREDTYDELIDGPRALPATIESEPTQVSDLQGRSQPVQEQADTLSVDQLENIKGLMKALLDGLSESDAKKFKLDLRRTFGFATMKDIPSVSPSKADDIIKWLNLKIDQREAAKEASDSVDDFQVD